MRGEVGLSLNSHRPGRGIMDRQSRFKTGLRGALPRKLGADGAAVALVRRTTGSTERKGVARGRPPDRFGRPVAV